MAKRRNILKFWFIIFLRASTDAHYNDIVYHAKANVEIHHQRVPRIAIKTNEYLTCAKPSVYICEEPPNVIPQEKTKLCSYRNSLYHEQVFRWVAGRGCLLYTPDFHYVNGINKLNLNAGCYYGDHFAPCLEIVKDDGRCGCYPFDPGLEEVLEAVREAQITAIHGRWERCFYEAAYCCSHFMGKDNSTNLSDPYCAATFDGWTCWPSTERETVASEVCPEFAYGNEGPFCDHYSSKRCHSNGTWEYQTEYSTCSVKPRLIRRYEVHIVILAVSIVMCLPAVLVLFYFSVKTKIKRLALHRNFLIAIILRNVAVVINRSEVYLDELTNNGESTVSVHSIACRILVSFERVTNNAVFVCMLIEGFYMHRLVAKSKQKINMYVLYGVGAVITVAPVIVWSILMGIYNDHSCWLVYTIDNIQWILDAPLAIMLLLNTALFVDILRVLLMKNTQFADISHELHTTISALILMPLLGFLILLTMFRPDTRDCTAEQMYYYATYTVEGFQGFLASILYCYMNKEVFNAIKQQNKNVGYSDCDIQKKSKYFKAKFDFRSIRLLRENNEPENHDTNNMYAKVLPRLQVAEIISINAPESLAEILEPVYESVAHYTANETYDSLERADYDFVFNKTSEDTATNASSLSTENQNWVRCVSTPNSSFYNYNGLSEFEIKYLQKKFPDHFKRSQSLVELNKDISENIKYARIFQRKVKSKENEDLSNETPLCVQKYVDENGAVIMKETDSSEFNDSELLDEILQIISSSSDTASSHDNDAYYARQSFNSSVCTDK